MKAYTMKIWNWFKALPWYYKVVAVPVLLLLVVLGVLLVISKILETIGVPVNTGKLDNARAKEDKVETKEILGEIKAEEKIIAEKKEEIVKKLEAAGAIAEKAQEDTAKIKAATTMAELDALQKALGL